VLRAETRFDADTWSLEQTGVMTVDHDPDEDPTDPIVWYTLGRGHLLELLAAARSGATNSELLLALDAAALDDHADPL
jgi:hypothetical protein